MPHEAFSLFDIYTKTKNKIEMFIQKYTIARISYLKNTKRATWKPVRKCTIFISSIQNTRIDILTLSAAAATAVDTIITQIIPNSYL